MHHKAICSPVEHDRRIDQAVLGLLIESAAPWHVSEVQREIKDAIEATDSLNRLVRVGLVHRHDDFVFPTRAAIHAEAIHG